MILLIFFWFSHQCYCSFYPQESPRSEQDTPCLSIKPTGKDFYKVLGVTPDSNEDEIRKAYRKMALKFHPDKNSDADAEDRFKEIAEAYEILADPKKRSIYDQFGEEGETDGALTFDVSHLIYLLQPSG